MTGLDMEVARAPLPDDGFLSDDEWDALAHRCGVPFSQGTSWLRAWWRHYGDEREPLTFVFRRDGDLAAIVPVFVEQVGVRPWRMRVAKLAGCDHSPFARAGLMAEPAQAAIVLDRVVRHLVSDQGCGLVTLGPFRDTEAEELLHRAGAPSGQVSAAQPAPVVRRSVDPPGVGMWLDTSGGEHDFTRRMSAATRKSLRRRARKLIERPGFVMERVPAEEEAAEFERFRELHQLQWQALGQQGHFADWPDASAFHDELVDHLAARGELHLYRATLDGRPVAYEYMVRFGERASSLLAARSLDPEVTRAGIGSVLLDHAASCEAADGAVELDLGRGHYDYKASHGALSDRTVRLRFFAPERAAQRGAGALLLVSRLAHLGYYRLWFGLARPALHLPARELARWFIKIQI